MSAPNCVEPTPGAAPDNVSSETSKTPPFFRVSKAAHDLFCASSKPRLRTQLLALSFALLRAENDSRAAWLGGEPFTVSKNELSRLSGLSDGSISKCLREMVRLGWLEIHSGKFSRCPNTYRILQPGAPPRRALANAPKSVEEVHAYVRDKGLDISAEIVRAFWTYNEAKEWMISNGRNRPPRPCRDWRKLLVHFARVHRPQPPEAATASATAPSRLAEPPEPLTPASRIRRREQATALVDMPEPMCARAEALCHLLGRSAKSPWSADECAAYRESGIDALSDDSFSAQHEDVAWYYGACERTGGFRGSNGEKIDGRRTKLIHLIRHWPDEVVKARRRREASCRPCERGPQYVSDPVIFR